MIFKRSFLVHIQQYEHRNDRLNLIYDPKLFYAFISCLWYNSTYALFAYIISDTAQEGLEIFLN
jgi:hypothetical protein